MKTNKKPFEWICVLITLLALSSCAPTGIATGKGDVHDYRGATIDNRGASIGSQSGDRVDNSVDRSTRRTTTIREE